MVGPDGSVGIQGLSTVSLATAAEFDATLSTRLKRYVTSHPSDGVIDPFDSDRKRESRSLSHFALFVDAFDEADDEDEKRGGPRWGHLVFLFLADPLLQPTKSLDFSSGRFCASHHRDERPPFSSNVQWAVALTAVLVQAARVDALANATQTAAASRGAPPFHKSKLTMLLKGPTPLVVVTPPHRGLRRPFHHVRPRLRPNFRRPSPRPSRRPRHRDEIPRGACVKSTSSLF